MESGCIFWTAMLEAARSWARGPDREGGQANADLPWVVQLSSGGWPSRWPCLTVPCVGEPVHVLRVRHLARTGVHRVQFARYSNAVVHCATRSHAELVLATIGMRMSRWVAAAPGQARDRVLLGRHTARLTRARVV
jgi:hypothetical protein